MQLIPYLIFLSCSSVVVCVLADVLIYSHLRKRNRKSKQIRHVELNYKKTVSKCHSFVCFVHLGHYDLCDIVVVVVVPVCKLQQQQLIPTKSSTNHQTNYRPTIRNAQRMMNCLPGCPLISFVTANSRLVSVSHNPTKTNNKKPFSRTTKISPHVNCDVHLLLTPIHPIQVLKVYISRRIRLDDSSDRILSCLTHLLCSNFPFSSKAKRTIVYIESHTKHIHTKCPPHVTRLDKKMN